MDFLHEAPQKAMESAQKEPAQSDEGQLSALPNNLSQQNAAGEHKQASQKENGHHSEQEEE